MQTKEHPDDLTPREREVFGLLRLGLTNEEIAERLSISLDGAKYHVSQILSKLGVATREAAAAVAIHAPATHVAEAFPDGPSGQPRRQRWWAMLPLAAKAAGVAVVVAAVGGLGVLAWGVLNTSDGTEAEDSALPAADEPRIGVHWHAPYQFFACGEKQPNAAAWESGVHTHGDGILHIHPFQTWEEGSGARLVKWFEYGGGALTDTEINIPGSAKSFQNGDLCDGEPGELQVFVTRAGESAEERMEGDALEAYIPHDGDRIRIAFVTESPTAEAEILTLPFCTANDLAIEWAGENGAGGLNFGSYAFGNRLTSPCRFDGPPEVRLLDASGTEMSISLSHSEPCSTSPLADEGICEELGPVVLQPGTETVTAHALIPGQAVLNLAWRNANGASDCGSPRAAKVRLILRDGTAVDPEVPESIWMAPCEGRIRIWHFGPVTSPSTTS